MASKPLCLVSAGHQARRRETNHRNGINFLKFEFFRVLTNTVLILFQVLKRFFMSIQSTNQTQNQRANRNSNSNRNKNWTGPKRQSNFQPMAPLPSAGKYDLVDYEDSDLISRQKKGKSGIFRKS